MENEIKTAPAIRIPANFAPKTRPCRDGESECAVCNRPVKLTGRTKMLWVHGGGGEAVTAAEGERRNAAGEEASDLGLQPVGSDCLRRNPELLPYVLAARE